MNISLGRVLEAARERRATLTPEVAGYVILLAAQQLGAERSRVSEHSVLLDETGDVLVERAAAASELDIEAVLRALLGALIALCSSPPPAIAAVAGRAARGDLRELVAELSAALIPINHSAAHRALARLYREARRADGHAPDAPLPSIRERSAQPALVPLPAPEPAEPDLDAIDIEVELESDAAATTDAPELAPPELAQAASEPALPAPEPPAPLEELPPDAAELAPPLGLEPPLPAFVAEISPEFLPRDLLAPQLPTGAAPIDPGPGAPLISMHDGDAPAPPDEELRLVPAAAAPRWTAARSDVQQLLDAFLAETRSAEHVLRVLRDMIGLELPSERDGALDVSMTAAPAERSGAAREWPA